MNSAPCLSGFKMNMDKRVLLRDVGCVDQVDVLSTRVGVNATPSSGLSTEFQ